jgi:restriction endonuclease S subunit
MRLRALHEVCELLTDGTHYTPPAVEIGVPYLTVKDMTERGLDFDNAARVSRVEYEKAHAANCTPLLGDVLFSKDGTVGKVQVVRVDREFVVLSSVAILRPRRDVVLPEYLGFALRNPVLLEKPLGRRSGTALRRIILKDLRSIVIPIPPLSEQARAVDLLARAENIVRMRREAEQKAKEIIPALFLDMFGDPATNPKEWEVTRIEDCCTLVRGSSPRPQGDARYFGGPVPRLMIADITRDGIYVTPRIDSLTPAGAERSRPMNRGDVVMAVSGACGLPAILAVDACIHDGFVGFRALSDKVRPEYLYTFRAVMREQTRMQAVGATFQNLKTDQIREWRVPIPPTHSQDSFVDR